MTTISPVLQIGLEAYWSVFCVFCRIGAVMFLAPAFGEQTLPVRVKLGAAIAFTMIVWPAIKTTSYQSGIFPAAAVLGVEVSAGLFIGLLLRLMVHALEIAGAIAAQSTSLSQLFGGATGADPQPVVGRLMVMAGLAFACLTGLHVRLAEYLIFSYQIIPAGELVSPSAVMQVGLGQVTTVFGLGLSLAAPFVLAAMLYNVTLGVINRAMPQLMVAFIGAPAITAGGMILLILSLPLILSVWNDKLDQTLSGAVP